MVASDLGEECRRVTDGLPGFVVLLDAAGRISFVNRYAAELCGHEREALAGAPLVGTLLPRKGTEGGLLSEQFRAAVERPGSVQRVRCEARHRDGRRYPLRLTVRADAAPGGEVDRLVVSGLDAETLRDAEQASEAAQRLLDNILEYLPEGLVIADIGTRTIRDVSGYIAEFAGAPRSDFKGMSFEAYSRLLRIADRAGAPLAPRDMPLSRSLTHGEKVLGEEYVLTGKAGSPTSVLINTVPILDSSGEIAGALAVWRDIGSLKRVEGELREARDEARRRLREAEQGGRLLDAIMRNITEGLAVVEAPSGRILAVSEHGREMLGGSRETVDGVAPEEYARQWEILHAGGNRLALPGELPVVRAVRQGETVTNEEWLFRHPGGEARILLVSAVPVRDETGAVTLGILSWRDVTAGRQLREEIRRSEERFRTVLENSLDAAYRRDLRSDRYDYMSPVIEQITGFSAEEFSSLSLESVLARIHPDDIRAVGDELDRVMADGSGAGVIEYRFMGRDGRYRWLADNLKVLRDENGTPVWRIGIVRDVTARKSMEDTLRRNAYELRTLVDNSPDLVVRFDREMRYIYANASFERLTGLARERIAGKTNEELGMAADQRETWGTALRNVLDTGREGSFDFALTGFFGERFFWGRLIPEFGEEGAVDTVMMIARDVTERRRAEEHIRYISFHDSVTGLYNRAYFEEELRRLDTDREMPVGLIMGDVNNLKLTNDTFGHAEGDSLLARIATILRASCRKGDIIARWGGDEFVVILPKTGPADAAKVVARIREECAAVTDTMLPPSIALGSAVKARDAENIYQVLREAEAGMYADKAREAEANRHAVLAALLREIERRGHETREHVPRLRSLAAVTAGALGLDENQRRSLDVAAGVHDIGKIVVPEHILAASRPLTDEEWSLVTGAPEAGYRIARSFGELAFAADIILSAREHWDGSGYPHGRSRDDIPLLSRILAVVDAYDVMTHDRSYERAFASGEAAGELRRLSGRWFDPGVVDVFVSDVVAAGGRDRVKV